jgi:hypothetical protein
MTSRRIQVIAAALSLTVGSIAFAQADAQPEERAGQFPQQQQEGGQFPDIATPDVVEGEVEPEAVDILKLMSEFLLSNNTLHIVSESSLDAVTNDGQRIQMDGVTTYRVRKPNGFVIEYASAMKPRNFYYDGKTFTVYSPKLGFYAQVPAPATNREVLDLLYKRYGIALPLEDLFRWGDNEERIAKLKSAYEVGPAIVDGVETNHYAFREENIDWELWTEKGDRPIPRKLVIVDRTDPARPTFIARLKWTLNPSFTDKDFTYVPGPDAKKIQLATSKEGE